MKKLLSILFLSLLLSGCETTGGNKALKPDVNSNSSKDTSKEKNSSKDTSGKKNHWDAYAVAYDVWQINKDQDPYGYKVDKFAEDSLISEEDAMKKVIAKCEKESFERILKIRSLKKTDKCFVFRTTYTTYPIWTLGLGYQEISNSYVDEIWNYQLKLTNEEYKKNKIKEEKEKQIAKEIYEAQIMEENKKKCEQIGFTPNTENFAKCILKLIEINEIRQAALLDSESRASLEAKIQEQATDIQNKIAEEAKASRDQEAWAALLGMTTGNSVLSPSSTKSSICFKTSEAKSGLGKICYYNCGGTTKAMNINATQLCPINANL
ncbi:hypothetical protein [Candidatus Pelagibacter sp. HIMB1495]|uniref:hypothetical protein n=1 Tax=unclassified Candidatus Pelagibacter TaxID=2647897 RepID=UPI003F868249